MWQYQVSQESRCKAVSSREFGRSSWVGEVIGYFIGSFAPYCHGLSYYDSEIRFPRIVPNTGPLGLAVDTLQPSPDESSLMVLSSLSAIIISSEVIGKCMAEDPKSEQELVGIR